MTAGIGRNGLIWHIRAAPGLTLNIHYPSWGILTNHTRHRRIAFTSLMLTASHPKPCIPRWNQIGTAQTPGRAAILTATSQFARRKLRG
jgi:hypothetical protein